MIRQTEIFRNDHELIKPEGRAKQFEDLEQQYEVSVFPYLQKSGTIYHLKAVEFTGDFDLIGKIQQQDKRRCI